MTRSTKALIGAIVISAVNVSSYATLSNYLTPLSEMFGLTMRETSLVFTLHGLMSLVGTFLVGMMLRRNSAVKHIIAGGAAAFAACFLCVFFARTMTAVYAGMALMGLSFSLAGLTVSQILITWWSERNVGRRISYVSIGFSLTSFVVSPLIAKGILLMGVRYTALVHGLVGSAVIMLADLLLVQEHPDRYGVVLRREEQTAAAEGAATPLGRLLRTYPFWLIFIGILLFNTAFNGFNNNASVFYQSIGADPVQAAYGISIYGIVSVGWSLLHGVLADRKGPAVANGVHAFVGGATLFAATFLHGFAGVAAIGFFIGSMCVGGNLAAVTYPRVYGGRDGSMLINYGNAAANLSGVIAAPIAAWFFDTTGSYNGYLYLAAAGSALCLLLMIAGTGKRALRAVEKAR